MNVVYLFASNYNLIMLISALLVLWHLEIKTKHFYYKIVGIIVLQLKKIVSVYFIFK